MGLIQRLHIRKRYKNYLVWQIKHISAKKTLIFVSVLVGILCGLAAVLLKNLVSLTYRFIMSFSWAAAERDNLLFLMYPMVGIAITVILVKYVIKDDLSHGVSKVMYSISRSRARIKMHNCWSSMLTSSITVAFGGSVGLEAPIVYTGSAIAANTARFFRLHRKYRTILIGCGAAGAIAGAFKAPIAGVLFVFEVLMIDMSMATILPLLISSVSSAMISYFFLGQSAQFSFPVTAPFELSKIPAFIILGVVSAAISLYYFNINSVVGKLFSRMHTWVKVVAGGLCLGVMVYIFPPLFGEGYNALGLLLNNNTASLVNNSFFASYGQSMGMMLVITLAIIVLKAIATSITCSAGGVGGVFAPSLFIGGFAGYLVAGVLTITGLAPDNMDVSNFVLVGMASVMTGIMYSPMTSIFLIAEITGGYALFTPLMISTTICYLVVKSLHRYSIYAQPLAKKGDLMTHNKDITALHFMDKTKILETNFYKLNVDATLREVVKAVQSSNRSFFPVVDKENYFKGVLVLDDVRGMLFEPDYYDKIKVKDMMRYSEFFIADINDPMEKIVDKFKGTDRYTIIIVDEGRFAGCMSRANVFQEYQRFIHEMSDE